MQKLKQWWSGLILIVATTLPTPLWAKSFRAEIDTITKNTGMVDYQASKEKVLEKAVRSLPQSFISQYISGSLQSEEFVLTMLRELKTTEVSGPYRIKDIGVTDKGRRFYVVLEDHLDKIENGTGIVFLSDYHDLEAAERAACELAVRDALSKAGEKITTLKYVRGRIKTGEVVTMQPNKSHFINVTVLDVSVNGNNVSALVSGKSL